MNAGHSTFPSSLALSFSLLYSHTFSPIHTQTGSGAGGNMSPVNLLVVGMSALAIACLSIRAQTLLGNSSAWSSSAPGEKSPQNIANICSQFRFAVVWRSSDPFDTAQRPTKVKAHTHTATQASSPSRCEREGTQSPIYVLECCEVFISNTSFRVIFFFATFVSHDFPFIFLWLKQCNGTCNYHE